MASTDLLDYNQVIEQSPSTGDSWPTSGGLLTWNFRCDPNLSWDPSQSFFTYDVEVESFAPAGTTATADEYYPGPIDFPAMFPLKAFSSMSHIIDGVTVANSNHPWADKLMQERYLTESTLSNGSNFEALSTARMIDDGVPEHNAFMADTEPYSNSGATESHTAAYRILQQGFASSKRSSTQAASAKRVLSLNKKTFMFQPPFDFWTKHQRCSGGNHQISLNVRAETSSALGYGMILDNTVTDGVKGTGVNSINFVNKQIDATGFGQTTKSDRLKITLSNPRLYRRMVRYTIERPISVQEFNVTEMQFFHGQASGTGVTQNFLLPSSTFGIAFYWRRTDDSQYGPYGAYPVLQADTATAATADYSLKDHKLDLNEFYFTYGGETYPSQRITNIKNGAEVLGYEKMQMLSHQLQGVYNTDMERFNTSIAGLGLLNRLDASTFFFPVAKHNNSDNSDLQVTWSADSQAQFAAGDKNAVLVVVAFYDARVELSYNTMNQLEKVTKTEWR